MKRVYLLALITLSVLLAAVAPVQAQGTGSHSKTPVNWQQRDTAIYVVSTLNLLTHRPNGTTQQWLQRLQITLLDVYADSNQAGLYFIALERADGSTAGTLAYELGWAKPRRIAWQAGHGIPAVSAAIAQAYRTDTKTLIGSFTSTLP